MLQRLDTNFRAGAATDGLRWIDAFEDAVALRGLGWVWENRAHRTFCRIPGPLSQGLSESVQFLAHCPAGVFLSFSTDSTEISGRINLSNHEAMSHMPLTGQSGVELYFRNHQTWHAIGTGRPNPGEASYTINLIKNAPGDWREYRLYLPLYKRVESVALGIQAGARIESSPASPSVTPIVFYGTSITQGGCANTAGSDYVSQVGRLLDAEVINLGFSGNGKGEPEMADLISTIDAQMIILDYVANVSPDQLRDTLPPFFAILRRRHPTTPIVLIGNLTYNQVLWDKNRRQTLELKRDILMEFYLSVRQSGDQSIHFIDGNALVVAGQSGTFVDGVHPTSAGFIDIARNLAPQLALIQLWQNR